MLRKVGGLHVIYIKDSIMVSYNYGLIFLRSLLVNESRKQFLLQVPRLVSASSTNTKRLLEYETYTKFNENNFHQMVFL